MGGMAGMPAVTANISPLLSVTGMMQHTSGGSESDKHAQQHQPSSNSVALEDLGMSRGQVSAASAGGTAAAAATAGPGHLSAVLPASLNPPQDGLVLGSGVAGSAGGREDSGKMPHLTH